MERRTYRIQIAYCGAAFFGFARQGGLETVESALRGALAPLIPDLGAIAVGGRTDRGVHATGQVISLVSRHDIPADLLGSAIDSARPGSLTALDVRTVPRCFHAQFSACFRRYVYLHRPATGVDVDRLNRMLVALLGRRCFGAFARDTPRGKSTVRTLLEARARAVGTELGPSVRFDFAGDAFLRRQVRVLVATALREAEAGAPDDRLVALAALGDRRRTAPPAPPEGLYLTRVGYSSRLERGSEALGSSAPPLRASRRSASALTSTDPG